MQYSDIEVKFVPEGPSDRGGDIRLRQYVDGEWVVIRNDYPAPSSQTFASSVEAYCAYDQAGVESTV